MANPVDVTAPLPVESGANLRLLPSGADQGTTPRNFFIPSTSVQSLSKWTVGMVRNALDDHEMGLFGGSSLLADAIMRDPQVFAHLMTRVSALSSRSGLPFSLEASTGIDDRRASKVAKQIEAFWWDAVPEEQIAALLGDAIILGLGVGRIMWAQDWTPRFERLRPHGLYWSEFERVYRYIDGAGGNNVVTPGQNGWVLYTPFGPDSWKKGAILPLGLTVLGRQFAQRDWWRASEKHGLPILKVKEPFAATDDVDKAPGQSQADQVYQSIGNLASNGSKGAVLRLPQPQDPSTNPGFEATWMELVGDPFMGFEKLLAEGRREIISTLLGRDPEGSASRVGGDGASILEKVRSDFLLRDASTMAKCLRGQVLKPWVHFNVDPNLAELAPWPTWDSRPPTDLATRATTLSAAADALQKLDALGIDIGSVLDEMHLTRSAGPKPPPPENQGTP